MPMVQVFYGAGTHLQYRFSRCYLRLGGRGSRRACLPGSAGASPSQTETLSFSRVSCFPRWEGSVMKILVLNAGSSTLKFSLIESDGERPLATGLADWSASPARLSVKRPNQANFKKTLTIRRHGEAVEPVLAELTPEHGDIAAVGHRIVHGGERYTSSVVVTPEVRTAIADLAELAPLHNAASLEGIEAATAALPNVPQVAVFDTAFHA